MVKKSIALLGLIGFAMSFRMSHLQQEGSALAVTDPSTDIPNYAVTGTDATTQPVGETTTQPDATQTGGPDFNDPA